MKLERWKKNKKKRNAILTMISIIMALSIMIVIYQSFAFFEEKKELNVIKGSIPDQNYDIMLSLTKEDLNQNKVSIDQVPEKDNNQKYEVEVICNNGSYGTWDYENWSPKVINFNKSRTKCTINFKENNDFEYPIFENIEESKKQIAEAITKKGIATSSNDSFQVMAENIGKIGSVTAYTQNFNLKIQGDGANKTVSYNITQPHKAAWAAITNVTAKLIGYSPQQGASSNLSIGISGNTVQITAKGSYHTSSSQNSGMNYSGTFLVVLSN